MRQRPLKTRRWALVCFLTVHGAAMATGQGAANPPDAVADDAEKAAITSVWANTGEDKVARTELRARQNGKLVNSVWDGTHVALFGARNEIVSFNLILEAGARKAEGVALSFLSLSGPNGFEIKTKETEPKEDWRYTDRNIELFFVRYLEIKGISTLTFNYWNADDSERHLPPRFRRPHDSNGSGRGTWTLRPDHNAFYPDIAVPLAFHSPFEIPAAMSQSVWVDIYIPKLAPPGKYIGHVEITESGTLTRRILVELDVRKFTLPDLPTARTMLFINRESINRRYLGKEEPSDAEMARQSRVIIDRHFQTAHRHRISLIDAYEPLDTLQKQWRDRLSGALFTPERGYDGPGVGVGNNVYSIGTYTTWPWQENGERAFYTAADRWVTFFETQKLATPTDYFLYLLDESQEFDKIEQWATWARRNPGPGKGLRTLATLELPKAERTPSLDIVASTPNLSMREPAPDASNSWRKAFEKIRGNPNRSFFLYNGSRPLSGTFAIEDDGIAPRQLAWIQYELGIDRWFFWEGTYYNNFQYHMGETNVFETAHCYGALSAVDPALGETGDNYDNGNGILFYPGTDKVFERESYDFSGPIASLRLKHWRRGIQDHDYLVMAAKTGPQRVKNIINGLLPEALWAGAMPGSSERNSAFEDIGWTTDPDRWEAARRELADIIEQGGSESHQTGQEGSTAR